MLKTTNKTSLVQDVLSSIKQYVVVNKLQPGDFLPSERVLAMELGVSCNTVRLALEPLEAVGALERRPRTGSMLKEVDLSKLSGMLQFLMVRSEKDLSDLDDTRLAIEVAALEMAIKNADEDDFERMESALLLCETETITDGLSLKGDEEFHLAIIAATHNVYMQQISGLIHEFFSGLANSDISHLEDKNKVHNEHKAILEHIRNHDLDKARAVLTEHLNCRVTYSDYTRPRDTNSTDVIIPHILSMGRKG